MLDYTRALEMFGCAELWNAGWNLYIQYWRT